MQNFIHFIIFLLQNGDKSWYVPRLKKKRPLKEDWGRGGGKNNFPSSALKLFLIFPGKIIIITIVIEIYILFIYSMGKFYFYVIFFFFLSGIIYFLDICFIKVKKTSWHFSFSIADWLIVTLTSFSEKKYSSHKLSSWQ